MALGKPLDTKTLLLRGSTCSSIRYASSSSSAHFPAGEVAAKKMKLLVLLVLGIAVVAAAPAQKQTTAAKKVREFHC